MGAYHGKAGFDTFSHYRAVVGSDLPFSITGTAAPPFGNSLRFGANVALGWRGFARTAHSSAVAPISPAQLHTELLGRHRMAFGAADFD